MTVHDDLWITIPNWERFQHYRDRDPVWIKVYTELVARDDWHDLPLSERGLVITIWLAYARTHGELRVRDLRRCVPAKRDKRERVRGHLTSLNHAGWIRLSASKPLARARARSRQGSEERKKENARASAHNPEPRTAPPSRTSKHHDPDRTAAAVRGWIESPGFDPEADDDQAVLEEIGRAERRSDTTLSDTLRAELLELARHRRQAAP